MAELWLGIVIITLFVVACLLRFLIRKPHEVKAKRINYDIAIFKHQLTELESDLKHGIIMEASDSIASVIVQSQIYVRHLQHGIKAQGRRIQEGIHYLIKP